MTSAGDVRTFSGARLVAWTALVATIAALNYGTRFLGTGTTNQRDVLYTYGAAVTGLVFYGVFFGFVYWIAAVDTRTLLALRRPGSLRTAARLALGIFVGVLVWSWLVALLPLPQSPSSEQGLTPTHWEPAHAGAYAANFVVVAMVAPFVEELAFRGDGYGLLLGRCGRWATIVLVGVAFGLAHGLLEGLLVLVPFGSALAYLRSRTNSVVPGMVVHFAFNALALVVAVTT